VLESDHVASDATERDGAAGQVEPLHFDHAEAQRKIPPSEFHVIRNRMMNPQCQRNNPQLVPRPGVGGAKVRSVVAA
jgi:hypothetical protein